VTAPKKPGTVRSAAPAREPLPPVTVAKLDEAMGLVERLVEQHTETFLQHGQAYKDRHREGSRRPLTAVETAQLAAGLGASLADTQQQVDEAGLTAYDEPQGNEVLLAAGIATGTAFMHTAKQLTALIEMSDDDLETACEADRLSIALDEVVKGWRRVELEEMRGRVVRALEHVSKAAGFDSGKALALAGRAVWQGLWTAMASLEASGSGLSTVLAASTDGAAEKSSTTSPGATS
jgi:hypothetical protein